MFSCFFRENLLKLCWRIEPTKRPTAAEIVELLGNITHHVFIDLY